LASLKDAANNEVVIIDLEDGQAWWETRLLVLLAGASRLNRPDAAVFVATVGGKSHQFQGWGYCRELFCNLLQSDAEYLATYQRTRAAANVWAAIEPGVTPTGLTGLALNFLSMAFRAGGPPNEFAGEQLLASELGSKLEMSGKQQSISTVRL